ncbi:MAG: helix-turn-helix transcriptional regulator [Alphaproteobacteria bacterium]|nr:helix-turn-helix transcriptional regulator [Alphaproteobacteria bacterium]
MKSAAVVIALAALGQDNRLDAFRLLVQAGPGGLPAGQLAAKLDLAGPTLTFHLGQLFHAGLVHRRRDGRSIVYAANFPAVERLIAYLGANCAGSGSAAPQAANSNRGGRPPGPRRPRRG